MGKVCVHVCGWRDAVNHGQAWTYSSSMTSGLQSLVCVLNQDWTLDEPMTQSYHFLCVWSLYLFSGSEKF